MPFLPPNQQHQSTEDIFLLKQGKKLMCVVLQYNIMKKAYSAMSDSLLIITK